MLAHFCIISIVLNLVHVKVAGLPRLCDFASRRGFFKSFQPRERSLAHLQGRAKSVCAPPRAPIQLSYSAGRVGRVGHRKAAPRAVGFPSRWVFHSFGGRVEAGRMNFILFIFLYSSVIGGCGSGLLTQGGRGGGGAAPLPGRFPLKMREVEWRLPPLADREVSPQVRVCLHGGRPGQARRRERPQQADLPRPHRCAPPLPPAKRRPPPIALPARLQGNHRSLGYSAAEARPARARRHPLVAREMLRQPRRRCLRHGPGPLRASTRPQRPPQ
jgi:hypothetical protein